MSVDQLHQGKQQIKKYIEGRRQFFLQMIETAGYKEQNEKLMADGFNQLKKNLKLLVKNNGNFEATAEVLRQKRLLKQQHRQDEEQHHDDDGEKHDSQGKKQELPNKWMKKHIPPREETEKQIKELGFEEANKKLVEQGFHKLFINLKVLKRFNGDPQKSAAFMTEVRTKLQQFVQEKRKYQDPDFQQMQEQFQVKLKKFHKAGFHNNKKIMKALAFYNGDEDRAINSMNKVREWKRSMKQSAQEFIKKEEVKE